MISAYNKDSKKNETVFTYGTLKSKEPKNDSEQQPKTMTLAEAKLYEITIKDRVYKVGEMNHEQLIYLRDKANLQDKGLLDAVGLVLMDMARNESID